MKQIREEEKFIFLSKEGVKSTIQIIINQKGKFSIWETKQIPLELKVS